MLQILDNMPLVTGDTESQRQVTQKGVEGTGSGPFGDILDAQGRPPAAEPEADIRQEPVLKGGNIVQPGGKELPDEAVIGTGDMPVSLASSTAAAPTDVDLPPLAPFDRLPIERASSVFEGLPGDKSMPVPGRPAAAGLQSSVQSLPVNKAVSLHEGMPADKAIPGLEGRSIDKSLPTPTPTSTQTQMGTVTDTPAVTAESLPVDKTRPIAPDSLPAQPRASAGAQQPGVLPGGSAAAAQNASATTTPMVPPMADPVVRASAADKPPPVRASGTALTGIAAGQFSDFSQAAVPDSVTEGIPRDTALSASRAAQLAGQDAARLSTAVESAARVGFTGTEEAPAVARERFVLEATDLVKSVEPTQARQPVVAQTQPVSGSIPMPAGVAELPALPAGLKTVAPAIMTTPLGHPNWDGEFLGRVSLLVKNGMPEASLQLSPPELGRLDIRISTEGDQARVQFAVQSVDAREAIEQAMPRLREMLEQNGLQLAQSDVADFSQSRHPDSPDFDTSSDQAAADVEENMDESMHDLAVSAASSTVDYYV